MILDTFFSKLKYLTTTFIVISKEETYSIDINDDGNLVVEFAYPVQYKYFKNCDEVMDFINEETILKVYIINHENEEETVVYTKD